MGPTLHHRLLTYLDEVARSGSIRSAASRLNVASSAINRQILALEEQMGTPLFERLHRGLRLTAAGEILIRHVRDTLREHDRMLAQVTSLKGLSRGEVTIATMASLAAGVLAGVIREFRETSPGIVVKVRVLPGSDIVDALLAGEVDLALGYKLPANPRLHCIAEFEHRLGAVTAPDHPLSGRYHVRLGDCLSYPLVVADHSLTLRGVIESLTPDRMSFEPVVETNSIELMKRLAQTPPHVTFLNLADVGEEMRRGVLAFTPLSDARAITQTASLVQRSRTALDGAAHLLATRIEAAFERHSAVD
ncbi:LysR family transcriptional regulator [Methylobacterium gnaphalii]|uniref:Transcriptional regulator n=1 Tax=Methylobacterium gnaphalii TaxID=1010610 RepID=A0A512JMJ9_9HYPH|nr:LysR substrate-binding domain-containing protein [Methylobacterium gnaphalii]GEP11154.1 transcriptional regulator [Methylobacterium gnaphalii]GJD71147.1 HTH-type transcriptional regulator HdfR [Methylobacterium gnaphalii]GLS49659.1 transcriptional regulator [Methylobacterium gnaphalii]